MEEGLKKYLPLAGGALTGNVTASSGVTIDTVDVSAHAADGSAHQSNTVDLEFSLGDGVNAITVGLQYYAQIDFACTIVAAKLLGKESGSVVVDIWKRAYADFPPTDAQSITASAPPTLTTAQKVEDTTLTGWTKTIAAGDVLGFNVDSVTTITQVTLVLKVTKT